MRALILALGLLADPGDLGLRPLADGGEVVVGLSTQLGCLVRGGRVDLFDGGLGLGLEAGHRLVPGGLGGDLHGPPGVRDPVGQAGLVRER